MGLKWLAPCRCCKQIVMMHEVRNHGTQCVYCTLSVPDCVSGPEILDTEHAMAKEEARLRKRRKKHGTT